MTETVDEVFAPAGVGRDPRRQLRFLIIGGVNTAFGLAIYPALLFLLAPLHVHYMGALLMAQAVSLIFAFTTHKRLVFRTHGNILREFMKFVSFYLSIYVVNWIALPLLVEVVGLRPWLAQMGFAVVTVLGSYFFHSRLTFRQVLEKR